MADNDVSFVNNPIGSPKETGDKLAAGEPGEKAGKDEPNFVVRKNWHRICFGVTSYWYDDKTGTVCQDFQEPGVIHVVPIVNLMYDVFFDAPALPDQVKDTLNVIGLVSSLMLSIAVSFLFSFGFDDWVDAIFRLSLQDRNLDPYLRSEDGFDENSMNATITSSLGYGKLGRFWARDEPVSFKFGDLDGYADPYMYSVRQYAKTVSELGVSIVLVVVLYIILANSNFSDSTGRFSFVQYERWWTWCRWIFVASQLLTALGVVDFLILIPNVLSVMMPDICVARLGRGCMTASTEIQALSPYLVITHWIGVTNWVCMIGALLFASIGSTLKAIQANAMKRGWDTLTSCLDDDDGNSKMKLPDGTVVESKIAREIRDAGGVTDGKRFLMAYLPQFTSHRITAEQLAELSCDTLTGSFDMPLGDALRLAKQFSSK